MASLKHQEDKAIQNDAPNSCPKTETQTTSQSYVYRDFAKTPVSSLNNATCHQQVPSASLQSQKLPSKLTSMLSDPDLGKVITWMPHGRSWKILDRYLFSRSVLPRYFGHGNYSSFVRVVNAWGFRRITTGVDRDSYYHELFLRGKPEFHIRMKRLPTCHRKTPIDKENKHPNFYELAKTSPLPDPSFQRITAPSGGSMPRADDAISASVRTEARTFKAPELDNLVRASLGSTHLPEVFRNAFDLDYLPSTRTEGQFKPDWPRTLFREKGQIAPILQSENTSPEQITQSARAPSPTVSNPGVTILPTHVSFLQSSETVRNFSHKKPKKPHKSLKSQPCELDLQNKSQNLAERLPALVSRGQLSPSVGTSLCFDDVDRQGMMNSNSFAAQQVFSNALQEIPANYQPTNVNSSLHRALSNMFISNRQDRSHEKSFQEVLFEALHSLNISTASLSSYLQPIVTQENPRIHNVISTEDALLQLIKRRCGCSIGDDGHWRNSSSRLNSCVGLDQLMNNPAFMTQVQENCPIPQLRQLLTVLALNPPRSGSQHY